MAKFVITIDGPAGSGKSTIARLLAERIGASFLDTGAMYRAVTLAAMQAGVDMSSEDELLQLMDSTKFDFGINNGVIVVSIDGEEVTEQIRRQDVTDNSRYIASAVKVRERLVEMQRGFAAEQEKVVTEGRDQGTVAFPDADLKFYLTADVDERARRRLLELEAKGSKENLEDVRKAIEARDKGDQSREVGALKQADEAIVVDTTRLDIEQVVTELFNHVQRNQIAGGDDVV